MVWNKSNIIQASRQMNCVTVSLFMSFQLNYCLWIEKIYFHNHCISYSFYFDEYLRSKKVKFSLITSSFFSKKLFGDTKCRVNCYPWGSNFYCQSGFICPKTVHHLAMNCEILPKENEQCIPLWQFGVPHCKWIQSTKHLKFHSVEIISVIQKLKMRG